MALANLSIIAPAFAPVSTDASALSDAEYFGSAVWLWMQSSNHRNLRLHSLDALLLPAIRLRQFAMVMEASNQGTRPVAYLAWANLSAQAESRYVSNPLYGLNDDDWNSGDRMWFTDCFAPFGNALRIRKMLQPLFSKASARYLYHRSHERGVRVLTFVGSQVDSTYASQWWNDRPILATKRQRSELSNSNVVQK